MEVCAYLLVVGVLHLVVDLHVEGLRARFGMFELPRDLVLVRLLRHRDLVGLAVYTSVELRVLKVASLTS